MKNKFPITTAILDAIYPIAVTIVLCYIIYTAWAYFFPHAAELLG